ncbi:hypothetical protein GS429_05050 [Natronorubrum sp. JWXQ-INN-674]|uniref:Uncharacterized protein n=1 Tax=Natronorubrum halalkaliphilum TaxID=2691917 RepID=A0A6B0VIR1_9EURY|nr:hypothetical protein [Natronorubrum halalkaliphilum]MXV61440.1 hypothetical protein [Natronorubrum halalkaliphilum]
MSDEQLLDGEDDFETLLEDATESLENLENSLGDVEAIDELEDSKIEELLGDVEKLTTVASETQTLLETIDFSELPEAVDGDELLAAIETGEIPEVIADEDAGATDLVDFTQLFSAIDLLNAWDATDLGSLWQQKRALDDAVDDLAGDEDDDGMLEEAASAVTDDDEALLGGEDGDGVIGGDDSMVGGEDGLVAGDDDLLEADLVDKLEEIDADPSELLGEIDVAEDPEAYQVAIQQQAMKGIDAFREALLETHEKFEQLYEFNREKMRRQDTSTNSRNPTAAATIPTERRDLGGGARHSTVPQQVKLSTAPSRKRIYGRRFEIEREKKRRANND